MDAIAARVGWLTSLAAIAAIAWSISSRPSAGDDPAVAIANQARWRATEAKAMALLEQHARATASWEREIDRLIHAQSAADLDAHQQAATWLASRCRWLDVEVALEVAHARQIQPIAGLALESAIANKRAALAERERMIRAAENELSRLRRETQCVFDANSPARKQLAELKEQRRLMLTRLRLARARAGRPMVKLSKECMEHAVCRDPR